MKPISVMDCVELVLEYGDDGEVSLVEEKRLPGENNVSTRENSAHFPINEKHTMYIVILPMTKCRRGQECRHYNVSRT